MTRSDHIPAPAVKRLSLYLRQLEQFQTSDRKTISSRQLGEALSLSDAQVRKDLAYFGQFGYPGVGYRVPELILRVRRILGTDRESPVLLVGLGNLGRALLSFRGFSKKGFEVVAVFDKDPAKIGRELDGCVGLKTRPLDEMPGVVRTHSIRLGILAVPAKAAQDVAEQMVAAGIRGILNFAPVRLRLGPEIAVSSVDLAVYIEQLSFRLGAATT
jgi:redox-sensing transcriptional repressor